MSQQSEFSKKIIAMIKNVPSGKIATYGQIAALAGKPNASRAVVWILHSSSKNYDLPWHRIVNAKGKIAFPDGSKSFYEQVKLLRLEGVEFLARGQIDLASFQWKKRPRKEKTRRPTPKMFQ